MSIIFSWVIYDFHLNTKLSDQLQHCEFALCLIVIFQIGVKYIIVGLYAVMYMYLLTISNSLIFLYAVLHRQIQYTCLE